MELCLDDETVIKRICTFIPACQTLSRLAVVSKVFLEPALSELWKHLECPRPLLWVLGMREGFPHQQVLGAELVTLKWHRLDFYVHRVQALKIDTLDIDKSVLHALSACSPRIPLLPHLKTLRLNATSISESISLLPLFLAPTLSTLLLAYDLEDDPSLIYPITALLSTLSPNLTRIHFSPCDILLSLNVSTFRNLVEVDIPLGGPHSLISFLQLSTLKQLRIMRLFVNPTTLIPSNLPRRSFPALNHLVIRAIDADHIVCVNILDAIQCRVASLEIDIYSLVHRDDILFLLQCIQAFSSPALSSLTINLEETPLNEPITLPFLHPILSIPSLSKVSIGCSDVSLSNSDIERMARSWTLLRSLNISGDTWRSPSLPEKLSLDIFTDILPRHTPLLEELTLSSLNATTPPSITSTAPYPLPRLKLIHLIHSTIEDPAAVAGLLSRLAPAVRVDVRDLREATGELWKEVTKELQVLQGDGVSGVAREEVRVVEVEVEGDMEKQYPMRFIQKKEVENYQKLVCSMAGVEIPAEITTGGRVG